MADNKDYTTSTPEALRAEEKKIKRQGITAAVLIGFLIGVMIFGVVTSGFGFVYIVIPLLLISGIYRHSKKLSEELKKIQEAIHAK
jgi:uncharacterized membrane protein YoaK (UPF0700 family)